ncbi:uncharacterized protein SCHCODRAFT_02559846 [Schizophyllum commune H4-8]|uniref:uncharacterized protein n=1 Tax=Schizophyllum commune (strain H4-8 / FGSC 9210) TaxID=578458 RepID=UPI00215EA946|nr:uncharacterized protein SCHCODRAFT_02559846 [Schizophyllum commune H4-8]KAI5900841.1 hypothetical protein SCHCODRAFT_02559846 [Schizophyllum commune H4-8]
MWRKTKRLRNLNRNHHLAHRAMRRSARLASRKNPARLQSAYGHKAPDTPLSRELTRPVNPPPRKRQKSDNEVEGSTSALHESFQACPLYSLPLDVLYEVLSYVDPISLLNLSRTSNLLRTTLLSSPARWVWRTSYTASDHDLPLAPDDVTIPQFLSLLVDRICDFCHATLGPDDRMVRFWAARLRSCTNCLYDTDHIVREKELGIFPIVRDVRRYFGAAHPLRKLLLASEDHYSFDVKYSRVTIERLAEVFKRENRRKLMADKKEWLKQREAEHAKIVEHAALCKKWEEGEEEKKRKRNYEIQMQRLGQIFDRLKNFGWYEEAKELHSRYELRCNDFIAKRQPLTDEEWADNQNSVLQYLTELKARRQTEIRRETFKERYQLLKEVYHSFGRRPRNSDYIRPGVGDLVTFEEVKDFVEGTPVDQNLERQDYCDMLERIEPVRFPKWQAACEEALVALLNAKDTDRATPATTADLRTAAVVFTHKDPHYVDVEVLHYPFMLQRRPRMYPCYAEDDDPQRLVGQWAWSADRVYVEPARLRVAERLVSLAGLDPRTATYSDMQMRNPWYANAQDMQDPKAGLRVRMWEKADGGLAGSRKPDGGDSHVGDVHHLHFDRDHHIDSHSMRESTQMANTTDANSRADRVVGKSRGSTTPKQGIGREICPPRRKRREIGASEGGTASEPERTSSLQQMPPDILFEILGHLDLFSLFHLSRTSKDFRNTLISRSTRGIWKKCYAAAPRELPPFPEDVTIPQFLSFIVDNICDFCHASDLEDRDIRRAWAVRVRCCEKCIQESAHVLHGEAALRELKIIRDIHRYFGRDYRLDKLFPTLSPVRHHSFDEWFPRAPIERLAVEFERDNKRKPVEVRKQWLERRAAEHMKVQKYARICEEWEQQTLCRKIERDRRVQRERLDEILRRLSALGWGSEVQHTGSWHSLSQHPFAAKAEPLTEEDWLENRQELIQFTQKLRESRLAVERRKTIETRYRELNEVYKTYLARMTRREQWRLPGIGDLVSWQEVRDFIEGTPVGEEITPAAMRAMIDQLAQSKFAEWRASCEDALVRMLNAEDTTRARPATKADLRLAATVFCRKRDYGVACYPEALHSLRPGYFSPSAKMDDPYVIVRQYAWSAEDVCVKVDKLRAAEEVVRLAGLDPRTATLEDMDARDSWFTWGREVPKAGEVPDRKKEVEVLPWRKAMSQSKDGKNIVLLSEQQTAPIRQLRERIYWYEGGLMKWSELNRKSKPRKKQGQSVCS